MDWVGDEPAGREWAFEAFRLVRRAGRRPLLTLALALLAVALLFALQLRRPPAFAARAELLLRENSLSTDRTRLSRADLRSYVENIAFTSSQLMDLMDRHGLFSAQIAQSPVLGLAEMRRSIEVDVMQDYFAEDRLERTPSRSARIAITFKAEEPELAMVVVRDLGMLVARAELGRHAERARQQADFANAAATQVRAEATSTHAELAAMEAASLVAPAKASAAQRVKAVFLRAWLTHLERQRGELEQEYLRLDLAAAAEEKQAGTRVHLASLQSESGEPHNNGKWLRRKAAIAGTAGLALAVLLVGAFDPRLYDGDDIRRAGGVALGYLRRPHQSAQASVGVQT
jgi:hypothetical protein